MIARLPKKGQLGDPDSVTSQRPNVAIPSEMKYATNVSIYHRLLG
jgi:hypothetical protein